MRPYTYSYKPRSRRDWLTDLHAGVWLAFVAGTIFGIDLVLFVQAVGR